MRKIPISFPVKILAFILLEVIIHYDITYEDILLEIIYFREKIYQEIGYMYIVPQNTHVGFYTLIIDHIFTLKITMLQNFKFSQD